MSGDVGGVPMVLLVVFVLANCWAFTRIFSKAGFRWWWGLFTLIPIVGFFVPIFLAIVDWPIRDKGVTTRNNEQGEQ